MKLSIKKPSEAGRPPSPFCKIAKIMEEKSHLTLEGLKKIKSLKSGMNRGRILN